jgi:Zn finger protein HypA/HybF involved in hydrogenase expression
MKIKTCIYCTKPLNTGTKFCSHSCSASYNQLNKKSHFSRGKPKPKCAFCGKETRTHGHKYCNTICHKADQYNSFVKDWLTGKITGTVAAGASTVIKIYLRKKHGNKCQLCGWNKLNKFSGIVPVELDHIDGNHTNNSPKNVRLICPNCHSLTSTYRNLNKGNGRKNRK